MNPDTPDARTVNPPASPPPPAYTPRVREPPAPMSRARLEGHFRLAVFLVLLGVGAIATIRAYVALERSITIWLRYQRVPVAQALFSVVIVAACVWLIRAYVISRGD